MLLSQRVSEALPRPPSFPATTSVQPTQPSTGPPYPTRMLSDFMGELRRNEPNQRDVQKKLSSVLLAALEEQRRRPQSSSVDSPSAITEHIPADLSPESAAGRTEPDPSRSSQLRHVVEVMCKVCDQMLFMMVEWARGARFFRELKVPNVTGIARNLC